MTQVGTTHYKEDAEFLPSFLPHIPNARPEGHLLSRIRRMEKKHLTLPLPLIHSTADVAGPAGYVLHPAVGMCEIGCVFSYHGAASALETWTGLNPQRFI